MHGTNSIASRQILLLSGDIEQNPGWQGNKDQDSDYLQEFARSIHPGSNNLSVAHINIRSLRNKVDEVKLLLLVCRFDILAITETHLDSKIPNRQLEIENYKIARRDRDAGTLGGGCLVYIANHICSTRMKSLESPPIEGIWLKVNINSTQFIIGTIYRPPSSIDFFNSFHKTLEKVWLRFTNVLIVGDLNCDYSQKVGNIVPSTFGNRLQTSLLQFNYSVVNDQPTRVTSDSSTLIDLVIASKCDMIKNTKTLELGISDHMLVHACLCTKVRRAPAKIVKTRSFKHFDRKMFKRDIETAPWSVCSSFDDTDDCY